jgi:hypothetical protein
MYFWEFNLPGTGDQTKKRKTDEKENEKKTTTRLGKLGREKALLWFARLMHYTPLKR